MFGEKIRTLRKENKISQEELAEKLDVSRQSISLWENDQTQPSMEKVVAIANIFGVSTDALLLDSASKAENKTPKGSGKKLKVWEIVALVLGSPVWVSLCVAAAAVLISAYASLWAVMISLWAVFAAVLAGGIALVTVGVANVIYGFGAKGIISVGAGLAFLGLAILLFFGCALATKSIFLLTKKTVLFCKTRFVKEGKI